MTTRRYHPKPCPRTDPRSHLLRIRLHAKEMTDLVVVEDLALDIILGMIATASEVATLKTIPRLPHPGQVSPPLGPSSCSVA